MTTPKKDNFGDISLMADIPKDIRHTLNLKTKIALLEQYCANGGKTVSAEHAQHIIEEFADQP